ncbi:MAG: hypothetical protein U9O96_00945 [Candidatus Thermoplasmatota archaeon]|nr:hypothetical protein [Candidatus Thermoplasmatota archaeon]
MSKKVWVRQYKDIPEKERERLEERLRNYAKEEWNTMIRIRFRGRFAYIDAIDPDAPGRPTHLCRLEWLGNPDSWRFAFYKYSDERYAPCVGSRGTFEVTAEDAFDCSAGCYLPERRKRRGRKK